MAIESLLLVEGESDKSFFEQLQRNINLPFEIQVAPPKEVGGKANTKQGVYNQLPKLLKQLSDDEIKHLAIVIDADYATVNKPDGYINTLNKVIEIVTSFDSGFVFESESLLFKHNDGLADIGIWIMPNNRDEGMLEDFIKTCIHLDEHSLLNHAVEVVENLALKKFKHKVSKAEIATWLAWQEKPGEGLYHVVEKKGLLHTEHALFQELQLWLNAVFTA
jgi:hypothetical protein